jgi:hypothetical protein
MKFFSMFAIFSMAVFVSCDQRARTNSSELSSSKDKAEVQSPSKNLFIDLHNVEPSPFVGQFF